MRRARPDGEQRAEGAARAAPLPGRTLAGDVDRCGETVPDTLVAQLAEIVGRQPPATHLRAPFPARDALVATLKQHAPVTGEGGPNYRFPKRIVAPGEAVQITAATIGLLPDTFDWLALDLAGWSPCFAVVRQGAAVAVCFSSRIGLTVRQACVFTLPEFRGHGHAATATAAWGAALQAAGRVPMYSTSWDNRASQGVARKVGLIQFGADATWT